MVVGRRLYFIALFLLTTLFIAGASASVTGELGITNTLALDRSVAFSNTLSPTLQITLASRAQPNLRGEIRLHLPPASPATHWDDYITRAYVRARLPNSRLTVGKSAISWGDGFFFNATDGPLRSFNKAFQAGHRDSMWLLALYLPLGAFDFVEIVGLPALSESEIGGGGRVYLSLGSLKAEVGYIFQKKTHTPQASLQGHLGFDWWVSSSADISTEVEELRISAGLFHSFFIIGGGVFTIRLEVLGTPIAQQRDLFVGVEGAYVSDQSRRWNLLSIYGAHSEHLSVGLGYSMEPLEALTMQGVLNATFMQWTFEHISLTLSTSWLF